MTGGESGSSAALLLVGADGTARTISALSGSDGQVLTMQADGSLALEAAAGGGIGGSTGATDERVIRANGTGGATVQSSAVGIDDSGNVTGVGTLDIGATDTTLSRSAAGVIAVEGVALIRGSSGAADNALLRADGTGGSLAQDSGITVADTASGVAEMTAARIVSGVRTISSSPDTQLVSDDLLLFSAAVTVDLLTSVTTGRTFEYLCTTAATLTLDPGGTDTINGGGAGVALAIGCAAGQSVQLVRSAAGAWRAVQPVVQQGVRLYMYVESSVVKVALQAYQGGAWLNIKGPVTVDKTEGTSALGTSALNDGFTLPSGYATAADQPSEGDQWVADIDALLGVTFTPGTDGWLTMQSDHSQPDTAYYGIFGYFGAEPGSSPAVRGGYTRGGASREVAGEINNLVASSTTCVRAGATQIGLLWAGGTARAATLRGRASASMPAVTLSTPSTAMGAGPFYFGMTLQRAVLGGATVSPTGAWVAAYFAPGTLSW